MIRRHSTFRVWTRNPDGQWATEDGEWKARRGRRREWFLYHRNELFGHWEHFNKYGEPVGYIPFDLLEDAMDVADEEDWQQKRAKAEGLTKEGDE